MPSESSELEPLGNGIKEAFTFGALYHAADIQWVGGAIAGNFIVDKYGVNPWIVAGGVAATVTAAEFTLSNIAVNIFEHTADLSEPKSRMVRMGREVLAAGYASFAGSANGVKINDSLGLESTSNRRRIQAAIFGCSVGLWVTPLPVYSDGAELGRKYVDELFEDPTNFAFYSAASIGTIFGVSTLYKYARKKLANRKARLNNDSSDIS